VIGLGGAELPHRVVEVATPGRQALTVVLGERLVLGRDCDGLLVADPMVSRHHVELRLDDGAVVLRDLGSANGTWIGEHRVEHPEVLAPGGEFTIGATTIRLVGSAPSAPAV
jgi:pSer/pThr/pTyr-binding forkhead associated (FHA) protein